MTRHVLYRKLLVACLARLVAENYRRRQAGLEPDEWYWADKRLIALGYVMDADGYLSRWEF